MFSVGTVPTIMLHGNVSDHWIFSSLKPKLVNLTMGETEKPVAEANVVAPPPQPAVELPIGPRPGVKYPLQEWPFLGTFEIHFYSTDFSEFRYINSSFGNFLTFWYRCLVSYLGRYGTATVSH